MPSPIQAVLREFLEKEKLSHEQMIGIVQNRAELVARCFDTFMPQTLGQLSCLDLGHGMGTCHGLHKDCPTVIDTTGRFSLRTQGVFAGTPFSRKAATGDVYKTYGFSRSKEWLLIEINFCREANRYEKAVSVKVSESDLPTLLSKADIDPWDILMLFRTVINGWVDTRKRSYENICQIAQGIIVEDCMLSLIRT